MSGKCRNCGAHYGLHHYKTNQCPTFGKESPVGVKQEYQASVFAEGIPYDELLSQLAALLEACKVVYDGSLSELLQYCIDHKIAYSECYLEPAYRIVILKAAIEQAEREG